MKRRWLLVASVASLALPATGAEVDGRDGRFDDDLFVHLEGDWLLTRQIAGRPQVQNTVTASWVLQHQFLLVRMRDTETPARYEADVYIGYSNATGQYVAHWLDNFGGGFSAMGRGTRAGLSVEFRFEYPDGPFFNTFTWDPESDRWRCHLESVGRDGARRTFARDTLVRPR